MRLQVAIMAARGRTKIRTAMLARLAGPGGLFTCPLVRPPRIYFAGPLLDLLPQLPPGHLLQWDLVEIKPGPPLVPQFWRVFLEADPTADLLFLEDDAWIVEDGVRRIGSMDLPAWAGAVSYFDFRNEGVRSDPGALGAFWPMPIGRDLWGTQCVRVPAAAVAELAAIARRQDVFTRAAKNTPFAIMNAWDGWLGRAVESIGLRMTLHTPSFVQHLGVADSLISPMDHRRPIARNFPEAWPTIVEDVDVYWCGFHGTRHDEPSICPETPNPRP